jgi:hypothetical protein
MNRLKTAIVGAISGGAGMAIIWWFIAANVSLGEIPNPAICIGAGVIVGFVAAFIVKEEDLLKL